MPRSASSVTFQASQPCRLSSTGRRKWFEVPPSGTGRSPSARPGLMTSKSVAYSMVKKRVSQLSSVLSINEPRLQAGDVRRGAREGRDREPQLVAMGHVLGVVDGHELAAREGQRDVERARL